MRAARDDDGAPAPLRERSLADDLRRALKETGRDDAALADELAAVVLHFVDKTWPPGGAAPFLTEVADLAAKVLAESGHEAAARAYRKERARRDRVRRELLVRTSDPPGPDDVAAPDLGGADPPAERWSAAQWTRRVMKETELPAAPAEEVVAGVERRLAALDLRTASEALIRELTDAELAERGLTPRCAEDRATTSRRALRRALESEAAPPEAAAAAPLFARFALEEIHDAATAKAHREGRLHLFGLERPTALERIEAPAALLVEDRRGPPARLLLRARRALERLRPHVAGEIETPDLAGVAAAAAGAGDLPEDVADDLLEALRGEDAFGGAPAPAVRARLPLDGFAGGASGAREREIVAAVLRRLAAAPEAFPGLRITVSTNGAVADDPAFSAAAADAFALLRSRPETLLELRRDPADDPFDRAAEVRPLRLSPARVAVNLPALLAEARGAALKDVLPALADGARLARQAFHERLWRQRSGAPHGVHGVAVLFGGPGRVSVQADGQEADLEAWGLPLALELLARRGVAPRPKLAEAAARLLGFLDYAASEEKDGLRLRVRVGAVRDRRTRLRLHAAAEKHAGFTGATDLLALMKESRAPEGVLPVVHPLLDPRNAPLLDVPFAERLGPGLAVPEASLPGGLTVEALRGLIASTRFSRLSFSTSRPGEGLFEVQEELFL
ncbi:MAG TPA: hypothetical protein VEI02_09670 [Planctomycetota bacterium]|nr:hypothetical protein [Planctomycetota bacterium]